MPSATYRNRSGNEDSSVAARDPLHIDSAFVEDCCRQTRSACLVSSSAEIAEAGAPLPAQALTPRDTRPKVLADWAVEKLFGSKPR